ncbi:MULTISPECIES: HAD family hydrolase [Anoxybacillaceae]|jgi:phosphoglycolate phosphatase-like HAD superfamily hydrolase|uniref:HAD family hydrolase n=1 Tax=Anoxybacillaceae TaxID=3120669 RepID=UPI0013747175|nr:MULTISPECIES: HAD hydrolase-like protein [Anoxybacillus]
MKIGIDLDGTILDSRERHKQALILASKKENVILPSKLVSSFVSEKSFGCTGLEVLKKYNIPNNKKIIENWIEIIEEGSLLSLDILYPDAEDLLFKYKAMGIEFYLVTKRKNTEGVINQIKRLGISHYFRAIHVVDPNFESNKEFKSIKAKYTREYHLDCVVGDTEDDYEWAKALNIKFYAISHGFRNNQFWEEKGIKSYSNLIDVFYAIEQDIVFGDYQ